MDLGWQPWIKTNGEIGFRARQNQLFSSQFWFEKPNEKPSLNKGWDEHTVSHH